MKQTAQFDHGNKMVYLTKAFAKQANVVGSTAYKAVVRLRQDFPNYNFAINEIAKNANKKTYARLNYKKMRDYISQTCGENSAALKEYERILMLSKMQSGCYAYVRKWFLGAFPNYDATPEWHELTDNEAASLSE